MQKPILRARPAVSTPTVSAAPARISVTLYASTHPHREFDLAKVKTLGSGEKVVEFSPYHLAHAALRYDDAEVKSLNFQGTLRFQVPLPAGFDSLWLVSLTFSFDLNKPARGWDCAHAEGVTSFVRFEEVEYTPYTYEQQAAEMRIHYEAHQAQMRREREYFRTHKAQLFGSLLEQIATDWRAQGRSVYTWDQGAPSDQGCYLIVFPEACRVYVGSTNDFERRLEEHFSGHGSEKVYELLAQGHESRVYLVPTRTRAQAYDIEQGVLDNWVRSVFTLNQNGDARADYAYQTEKRLLAGFDLQVA